jgi:chemosensory pili system protein ChpA (sensor histidine kinase/response regulator)
MLESNINEALARELDRLSDELRQPLDTMADASAEAEAVRATAADARDVVRRFSDTAEFCDMPALKRLSGIIEKYFEALPGVAAERRAALVDNNVLRQWPGLVAGYLRNPAQLDGLALLLDRFQEVDWPDPLSPEKAEKLRRDLQRDCSDSGGAGSDVTPQGDTLSANDVQLAFSDDINPQLADTFLAEAPERLARLSDCIQRLSEPNASREDASQAQRLAHTIKGSANITGVRGLANIVHWVEAILEHLAGHHSNAPRELFGLLLETTDCLETMLECLAAGAAAPEEALGILERLRLWAARVKDSSTAPETAGGAEAEVLPVVEAGPKPSPADAPSVVADAESMPAESVDRAPVEAQAVSSREESLSVAPVIRVAVDSVDRMLRLASELAMDIVQMQGRLANASQRTAVQRDHEQLLKRRLAGLQELTDIRGVPSTRQVLADGSVNEEFDPLELDQYNEMHSVVNAFTESLTDFGELNVDLTEDLKALDRFVIHQEQVSKELNDIIVGVRTVSVQSIVSRLVRCVRQTCRSTGKSARVEVEGGDLDIDGEILNRLVDPLMHMLRNAVDHGIELPHERSRQDKPENGLVKVQFAREGESLVVRCRDDGGGYDLERIRSAAQQRGMIEPGQVISDEDTVQLTFVPGFSTSETVTHISGRGIGLDVVRKAVQDLRGSLDVDFEAGRGTTVTLRVPLTLISMHLLLVSSRGQVFGIPSRMLHQTLYTSTEEFRPADEGGWLYSFDEQDYQVTTLDQLMGRQNAVFEPSGRPLIPLLLLEGDHDPTAVIVEEAVDSRYVAVQRLGDYVPRVKAVVGATILRDGGVAPVIDLGELIRRPAHAAPHELSGLGGAQPSVETPAVLIVDDSLSARRSMSEIIEDAGYRVRTAVDGLDAIDAIEHEMPVVVVLDLEMPNMNGLELAAHLRNGEATQSLPLLMVTSRSTSKHHQEAYMAGVDGIITKPWQDDDLVKAVNVAVASRLAAAVGEDSDP